MRRLLLIPALALLGCSNPLAPGDVSGVYLMVQFQGSPLPASFTEGDRTISVLADTVILRSDGTGRQIAVWETTSQGGAQVEVASQIYEGRYELRGREVRWAYESCPSGLDCITPAKPPRLTVMGNLLIASEESGRTYVCQGDSF